MFNTKLNLAMFHISFIFLTFQYWTTC